MFLFNSFVVAFNRKLISTAWYRHEIESELRGHTNKEMIRVLFSSYNAYDEILLFLERDRAGKSYPHVKTERCNEYLCSNFHIVDGKWDIHHFHCAAPVNVSKHKVFILGLRKVHLSFTYSGIVLN